MHALESELASWLPPPSLGSAGMLYDQKLSHHNSNNLRTLSSSVDCDVLFHSGDLPIFPPGTGNVLKIQELLHTCSEFHGNKEEEEGAESDSTPKEVSDEKDEKSTGKDGGTDGAKDTAAKKTDTAKQGQGSNKVRVPT